MSEVRVTSTELLEAAQLVADPDVTQIRITTAGVLEATQTLVGASVQVTTWDGGFGPRGPQGEQGIQGEDGVVDLSVITPASIGAEVAGVAAGLVAGEAVTRASADNALDGRLDVLEADDTTATALAAETAARISADSAEATARASAVSAEATTRASADTSEATARAAAVTAEASARATAVSAEASARTSADDALDARLDTLETDPTTGAALATETAARISGDNAEATTRAAAVTAEAVARAAADAAEVTARNTAIATAVANLINSAPGALDTLNELATALGDDPNFAATITTALAGKQPLDADLTAIAAVVTTTFGRALLALADAAALRTAAALGTAATANTADFDPAGAAAAAQAASQPLDADLTSIAALATTGFGRGLLILANAAALRTAAALGTVATLDSGTTSGTVPVLGASGLLAMARLATGTPDGTKFVRDDGTLATPPGGGISPLMLMGA